MKITVSRQMLSGNMGDGWNDDAAQGYANFLEGRLEAEVKERYPEAEVEISIDVQNASGCSRELSVSVDPWDDERGCDIERDLEESLSCTEDKAWEDFCGGEGAEFYAEEVK